MSTLRFHGDRVASPHALDFAVNVWPAPISPGLLRAMEAALHEPRYPDEQPAREAIGERHARPPDEVLPANGSCEVFWLLVAAFRPRHAACVHPSFTEPEAALSSAGVRVTRVLRTPPRWALRPEDVPEDADLVVLGNPNNPTGGLDAARVIESLAAPGRVLVVDEAFADFVPHERESLASRRDVPGLIVVRSLTKLWSLPGIRAGYALAPPELVERLAAVRQPWSVSAVACAALEWCARDRETPERLAGEVAEAREDLLAGLSARGLPAFPSVTNFVLVEVPAGTVEMLAGRGIAVRPAASFPGLDDRYVRIAVRPRPDTDRLLEALGA
jgi:histidinol-phosphate/aromatic aminotransferase/cobyric acid decarboxylase-like protein